KSGAEPMHVAYFRGVDNAEEIRDLLREGVRRQRDAGLGDPDEPAHTAGPADDGLHAAAMVLLEEARALRRAAAEGVRISQ
ncbi:MAG TPA: PH domain-containing protein, partial [Thermoanaerobaculia bacterium]|nr:PH domain-containing protein [Thermoanaerobaculia bacterium]